MGDRMAELAAISVYVRRAAGDAGLQAVIDFAADRGFRITAVPSRHCVLLRGSRTELEAAFDPIPPQLAMPIEAVLGLETTPADIKPGIALGKGAGDTLAALATSLDLPAGDGAGHCIGLISLGTWVDQTALAAACTALGIALPKPAPHLLSIDAAAPKPAPAGDPLLPMLLVLAALAPKARIVVYAAPMTLRGFIDATSAAVDDRDNKPSVVCTGWPQADQTPIGATLAQHAAAIGVQLLQPAADAGSYRLAAPEDGMAWTGPAIDVAVAAARLLRDAPAPADAPPAESPPARPYFDAVTLSSKPAAVAYRAWLDYRTDRYPGAEGVGALALGWALLPGSVAVDIAIGGDGVLWALGGVPALRGQTLFRLTPYGWSAAAAGGVAVAADGQGRPWLVDAAGLLLRFAGTDWRVVRSGVQDIAVAPDGAIWALSGGGVLNRPAATDADERPDWIAVDAPPAARIATAPDGTPWIVTPDGAALRHDGAAWVKEADNVHDVAVDHEGRVWVVSRRGRRLYCRPKPGGGWLRGEGVADRLAPQPGGLLWAVTPYGLVAAARVGLDS